MTENQHQHQTVEMRYNRSLGIDQAWLVGCPECGDKRTGYTDYRYPNQLVAEHNKEHGTVDVGRELRDQITEGAARILRGEQKQANSPKARKFEKLARESRERAEKYKAEHGEDEVYKYLIRTGAEHWERRARDIQQKANRRARQREQREAGLR